RRPTASSGQRRWTPSGTRPAPRQRGCSRAPRPSTRPGTGGVPTRRGPSPSRTPRVRLNRSPPCRGRRPPARYPDLDRKGHDPNPARRPGDPRPGHGGPRGGAMIEPQRGDRPTGRGHGPRRRGGDGPVLITRRALLAGGAAAALLAACSRGGDDAAGRGKRPTTTGHHHHEPPAPPAPTTGEAEATAAVDRVLEDGEHFPDGFTVPAGETWALADGAQVTTAGNVVVEGTLR